MSYNRIGEDFFITGSMSAAAFYGDGSNLTGISAGGGGGLTGSGTANYIAKFTSAGVLADSNIRDNGYPNGVSINYAPQTGVQLAIGNAVNPTTIYALNNYATSSTTTGIQVENIGAGTGSHIGISILTNTGANDYGLKIQDGRQGANKVLTSDADGNAYWATPTGGNGGGTASVLDGTAAVGYKRGTEKLYRMVRPVTSYTSAAGSINGESIYATSFYATPGSVIDEVAFRIQTAGASGLGFSSVRILIYKSKLNAAGEIVGGDLELDTGVDISTLSPGIKVVTGLNWTLGSTYRDQYFMAIRNYQTGVLSIKVYSNQTFIRNYAEINTSGTTMGLDNTWRWLCPYTASTPASMPATSSTIASTTVVAPEDTVIPYIGYSS